MGSGVVHHRMMATTGLRQARWNDAAFFLPRCPQASTGLCRGRAARVGASRMFGLRTARLQEHRHHVHLTISLTQSRQLDRPADGIGR